MGLSPRIVFERATVIFRDRRSGKAVAWSPGQKKTAPRSDTRRRMSLCQPGRVRAARRGRQARSKRSASITLVQAAAKSRASFASPPSSA